MSTFWSWYVIGLVVINLLGCVWLLWWTSRPRKGDARPDDTSHVWDGDITEYNKPLPRWWINLFYITIVYSVGYLFWYGGWGDYRGFSGWTSHGELEQEQSVENAKLDAAFAAYHGKPVDVIARDPRALKLGQAIYANTCATCHGSSAQGAIGFPNLRDDIWHWGGSPEDILTSVVEGREGVMPPWGTVLTGIGGETAIISAVQHTRSLSNPNMAGDYFAARGSRLYQSVCVACHGKDGKGNQALGAPDLTDDYWLYGNSIAQLTESIAEGRHGVMPPHGPILGDTRSRLVAAYVWSLSHPTTAGTAGSPTQAVDEDAQ